MSSKGLSFGRHSSSRHCRGSSRCTSSGPIIEALESRLLLSAAGGQAELFQTAAAVFAANAGQWASDIHYGLQGDLAGIAFKDSALDFIGYKPTTGEGTSEFPAESVTFSVGFDGADLVAPVGLDPDRSTRNYFAGDDPADWVTDVATFGTIAYEGLYAGIDLYTFARPNSLKYEFHVAPGADFGVISISYDGIEGLYLDDAGALHVRTAIGELVDDAPYIYQVIDGRAEAVAGSFRLIDNDTYTFQIAGQYDPTVELIIDPYLAWSTYLGGENSDLGLPGEDIGEGIAVDSQGNIWVTGYTVSYDFPTDGGFDGALDGTHDAFVTKFTDNGELLWSSYFGGSHFDRGYAVAVDADDNAFLVGHTRSSDFPTIGGFDTEIGGVDDAFVAKISSDGELLWATYVGGSDYERALDVAVDLAGNALVTGMTRSSDLFADGGFDQTAGGADDAFVTKVSGDGALLWTSYLGGSSLDDARGIAVDEAGNAFVTGMTRSSDFPTDGGFDDFLDGAEDAFVAKINGNGMLVWSSYLGGSYTDHGRKIAVDSAGDAIIAGWTNSPDFPTNGGFDTDRNGKADAFVAKVSNDGSLVWSSYLGGSDFDSGRAVAVDSAGYVLVAGYTYSADLPAQGGFDTDYGGMKDVFVAQISGDGAFLWCSYLGGAEMDSVRGIAVDHDGNALLVGATDSPEFPVNNRYDTGLGGERDAFVAKIDTGGPYIPGDFNLDGIVDNTDLTILATAFGVGNTWTDGDANWDGTVDLSDLVIVAENFDNDGPSEPVDTSSAISVSAPALLGDATTEPVDTSSAISVSAPALLGDAPAEPVDTSSAMSLSVSAPALLGDAPAEPVDVLSSAAPVLPNISKHGGAAVAPDWHAPLAAATLPSPARTPRSATARSAGALASSAARPRRNRPRTRRAGLKQQASRLWPRAQASAFAAPPATRRAPRRLKRHHLDLGLVNVLDELKLIETL